MIAVMLKAPKGIGGFIRESCHLQPFRVLHRIVGNPEKQED